MSGKLIRGRLLSFLEQPQGSDDAESYRYIEDGALLVEDGRIVALGEFAEVSARVEGVVATADHRPHLILPGLIDPHIHFVQMQVVGSWAPALLDWLDAYTFIEEQKFADPAHAAHIARNFFDELIRNGTTTAAAYCSVHAASVEQFFAEAARRKLLMIAGKVMMDRNAPEALLDTAELGYEETSQLIAEWHGQGRGLYAITPRFAITSTPAQLEATQALVLAHPDCFVQTHLSENEAEIALSLELYPHAPDYLGIYEHYGLLGPRTLMGHAIHLSAREIDMMAETGTVAVSCPTSNLFLGSGLFDLNRMRRGGVRVGVATDIGGGTSYSMLRTMSEFHKVLQMRGQRLSPLMAFYMMTLGNARALTLDDRIGTLEPGSDADLAVLDAGATPAMRLRMERAETLAEELFVLQTLGDDRAVAEVYVAGEAAKGRL